MKTLYKHVEFNQEFHYQGKEYFKVNHNRGRVIHDEGRTQFRSFKKNDKVWCDTEVTPLTHYMEVA